MPNYFRVMVNTDGDFRIREVLQDLSTRYVANSTVYDANTDVATLPLNENIIAAWNNGEFGADVPYSDPTDLTTEEKWARIRIDRNMKLAGCDWTQLPDVESSGRLTAQKVADWATYRQALADIPETYSSDPDSVVWPTPPEL